MPNTHVPAAGEAMPAAIITGRFSRRAMLVGAVASIPAIAGAVAAPAVHPDALLFRLDAEMAEANAWKEAACKLEKETYDRCAELHPPHPGEWKDNSEMPDDVLAYIIAHPFNRPKDDPPEVRAYFDAIKESKAAHNALRDAWLEEVQAINRRGGFCDAERAYEARLDEVWEIGKRIFDTPANILAGMMIKLRAGDRLEDHDDAFASVADDIRRMVEGGAA
ncbi:hypothetical protein [Mesorhizobium sp. AA23]|uniref:hypothetical protein n=1 Tax=Mesorhizobium sp. AA23 TaxID=1854058 RepID=UPI0008022EB1|nr:hypothetical protein [Mesorhizobium sp. AA23]OBQ94406.1 hypothetical protein A9K66_27410 [Mesorhizobium sp. AA23]